MWRGGAGLGGLPAQYDHLVITLCPKIGFEKCFMRRLRVDNAEPFYKQYIIKMMGILCLQNEQ